MLLNLVCFFSVPRGSTESRLERVGTGLNTHRLIASRNRSCSWSVHDSLDLVIVYGLRVLLASACFIVHVPSLPANWENKMREGFLRSEAAGSSRALPHASA